MSSHPFGGRPHRAAWTTPRRMAVGAVLLAIMVLGGIWLGALLGGALQ